MAKVTTHTARARQIFLSSDLDIRHGALQLLDIFHVDEGRDEGVEVLLLVSQSFFLLFLVLVRFPDPFRRNSSSGVCCWVSPENLEQTTNPVAVLSGRRRGGGTGGGPRDTGMSTSTSTSMEVLPLLAAAAAATWVRSEEVRW